MSPPLTLCYPPLCSPTYRKPDAIPDIPHLDAVASTGRLNAERTIGAEIIAPFFRNPRRLECVSSFSLWLFSIFFIHIPQADTNNNTDHRTVNFFTLSTLRIKQCNKYTTIINVFMSEITTRDSRAFPENGTNKSALSQSL